MDDEIKLIQEESWDLLSESFKELSERVTDEKNRYREDIEPPPYDEEDWFDELAEDKFLIGDNFHEYDLSKDKIEDVEEPEHEDGYATQDPNVFQKPTIEEMVVGPERWVVLEHTLDSIDSAIFSRDPSQLIVLFNRAQEQCHYLDIETGMDIEEVRDLSKLINVKSGELLFSPPRPSLIIPRLIIPVHSCLVSLIKDNPKSLFNITPRQFEELIAELFRDFGFEIELTRATRDGGRDIIAVYEIANIKTKYLVECKRYDPSKKISIGIVQKLFGVKMSEAANKAILVTTSSFTKPAIEFASKHLWDLDLRDYNDIIQWVNNYKTMNRPFI